MATLLEGMVHELGQHSTAEKSALTMAARCCTWSPNVGLVEWQCCIVWVQGLDGEATEPMVNELKEQEAAEAGSEEEFAVARALLEGSFLPQLLQRLQACETVGYQESAESTLLLRLLHQATHVDVSPEFAIS